MQGHQKAKEDTYCGKFLVRGSSNASPLDKIIESNKPEAQAFVGARFLSGWKHLQRFYYLSTKPTFAKLQKGSWSSMTDTFWILLYPGSFYITIKKSESNEHELTLWYSSSFRKNFPVAVANLQTHFDRQSSDKFVRIIRDLIRTKSMFQSQDQSKLQIPL